jgi:hypothetical protein
VQGGCEYGVRQRRWADKELLKSDEWPEQSMFGIDGHAAFGHTFVQFYPTLKPGTKNFGTYNEAREKVG